MKRSFQFSGHRWVVALTLVLLNWACTSTEVSQSTMAINPQNAPANMPNNVPAEYTELYQRLTGWQIEFSKINHELKRVDNPAAVMGAHLQAADANRGPILLNPTTLPGVELTLDRFQQLGIQGVTLVIGYPLLLPEFERSEDYLAFYTKVAEAVRMRGMKLLIEMSVLFLNSNFTPYEHDLGALTWDEFVAEQRQMTQTIIDHLRPDYITVLHEPQTFSVLTGLPDFYVPARASEYVQGVLAGLQKNDTLIGAGAGNWDDLEYSRTFVATDIDFLSLHIYATDPASIRRSYAAADIAQNTGLPLVLTEGWLYKSNGEDAAASASLAGWEAGFRRDVFSFWEPLDQKFMQNFTCFMRSTNTLYGSPYWTNYFFAYLGYNRWSRDRSYKQLVSQDAPMKVAGAVITGQFTGTGSQYELLTRSSPGCPSR